MSHTEDYIAACLFLRANCKKYGLIPIPATRFIDRTNGTIFHEFLKGGLIKIIPDCFKYGNGGVEAGIELTYKGHWQTFLTVCKEI